MNEKDIELAAEIQHLSEVQIEELYQKYLNGAKNADLIEEYGINVTPNKLITVFPPRKLLNELCPYCSVPMYSKRKSKSYSSWDTIPIECYECEHKLFIDTNGYNRRECRCENCLTIRHQERLAKETRQRNTIREVYNLDRYEPVPYDDLTFFQKTVLLTLFRMQTDEEFDYILSLDDPRRTIQLSPTSLMDKECIESLLKSRVIVVDPDSRITAFCEEDDFQKFYLRQVRWVVNISLEGTYRSSLSEVYNKTYTELREAVQIEWEHNLHDLIYKLSVEEVLQYLYVKSDELRLNFTAEKKTREVVNQLLENFAVSEIYYFVKKSVEDAHIFYTKGQAQSKKHAANIIPNKMLTLGERAINENWSTYKYNRDSRAPRSYLSQILFDFVLQDEDAGFTKAIGKYWSEELYPRYFFQEELENSNSLYCLDCGSTLIDIVMEDAVLKAKCKSCGITKEYISQG